MKMFITEQQLALYKYQPQSRYYNWDMASIVVEECKEFVRLTNYRDDIFLLLEHFLHKKIAKDIWEYHFMDNSILNITLDEEAYRFSISSSGINGNFL